MFAAKYAANGLLRTSKSLVAKRSQALRPMTVLSKESAQEYEKKVRNISEANPVAAVRQPSRVERKRDLFLTLIVLLFLFRITLKK